MFFGVAKDETEMDGNYVFLCGLMWCEFGQQEASNELRRAASSGNPDTSALAWAMLAKDARRLRELKKTGADWFSHDRPGKPTWMRSWLMHKALLYKLRKGYWEGGFTVALKLKSLQVVEGFGVRNRRLYGVFA